MPLQSRTPQAVVLTPGHPGPASAEGLEVDRVEIEHVLRAYLRQNPFPCSEEFRLGMIDLLLNQILGFKTPPRYPIGTVQSDAYLSGVEQAWHAVSCFKEGKTGSGLAADSKRGGR